MNKIFTIVLFLTISTYASAEQKCSDLPGFKKLGKDSGEYIRCLKNKSNLKLKTDSKITDWITGKEKFNLPNPVEGLKKVGKALKPAALEKK